MNNQDVTITIRANASLFKSVMQQVADQTKASDGQFSSAAKSVRDYSSSSDGAADKTSKLSGTMGLLNKTSALVLGTIAGLASGVVLKAFDVISSSVGNAISRVDTLNNSARTFANMGFTADVVKGAMDALNKSILGLPTSLDSGVRGVTAIAASINNLPLAQQVFTALNDSIIGFGGSTDMVSNAVTQLSQDLGTGRITAQTWLSLTNSGMTPALAAMARQMGITTKSLKEGLSDGSISVTDFMNNLIALDQKGGGGMASLKNIAHDATAGIGSGWANMQTAITRGMADIIQAVGSANISGAISNIGKSIEGALKDTANLVNFVKANKDIFTPIVMGLAALAAGFAVLNIIAVTKDVMGVFSAFQSGKVALDAYQTSTKLAAAAQTIFNAVLDANPIGIIIVAIAAVIAGLVYFFTQTKTGQQIVQTVFRSIGEFIQAVAIIASNVANSVSSFFKAAWSDISSVWNAVVGFFKGIWNGVVAVFNAVVGFFKQWGLTIIAVAFWPISLAVGLIITYWRPITAFFQGIWNGIVAIFTPIINFFVSSFQLAWLGITIIWSAVVGFFSAIWNGIVAIFSTVVEFYVGVFLTAWSGIVAVWNAAVGFFGGVWSGIVTVFSPIISWFVSVFEGAWHGIMAIFSGVGAFFGGVWNTIVNLFTSVGVSVANAIGGAIKGVVNGLLGMAEGTINGFIGLLNGAIGIINHIPGVHIPNVGELHLPRLATGGIVDATSGGQNITVAEGGQNEWIVPESKMASVVQQLANRANKSTQSQQPTSPNVTYEINVSVTVENDGTDFTDAQAVNMGKKIANAMRAQGLTINEIGALR